MDCKEWSHKRDEENKNYLQELKERLKKYKGLGGDSEKCIEPLEHNIARMEKIMSASWCTDDCTFCEVTRMKAEHGGMADYRQCLGPNDPKRFKDYPLNACKKYRQKDIIPLFPRPKNGDCHVEVPQSRFRQSSQENQEETDAIEVCTCSTDGCNSNPANPIPNPSNNSDHAGTTDKNYSNPATHPNILNDLFVISSLFVIRY